MAPATASAIRAMPASMASRMSGSKVRTVPLRAAVSGMTLWAVPAWNMVVEITAARTGSAVRDTSVCHVVTIWAPITTGSTERCGMAACPPFPWIASENVSAAASIGPGITPIVPAGSWGVLWRP